MFALYKRLFIAILVALVAAGITLMIAEAQQGTNPPPQTQNNECVVCHTEFQMSLENSLHGKSGTDPVFLQQWNDQGKPGACLVCHTTGYDPATATWEADGVTCKACHTDETGSHPKSPMTVNNSPDLCGRCHSDTRFGWQDWKASAHYQRGMNCTTCHDPHSASLKITGPRGQPNDISQLCINCHQEASMNFPYTAHHQKGVSCVDCHLEHMETSDQTAHSIPDHSFKASLETCNTCHADQMHSPTGSTTTTTSVLETPTTITTEPTPGVEAASITPQPTPVSPLGFAVLAALIGLAAGMVLAPWLERLYRRVTRRS